MRRYTISIGDQSYTVDVQETASDRFEVTVGDLVLEATLDDARDLPGASISPGIPSPAGRETAPRTPADRGPSTARGSAPGRASAPGWDPASSPSPGRDAGSPAAARPRPATGEGAATSAGAAELLAAPMPGVILEILVEAGASVRRGDPILVLEAMKMRNTIRAPRDARITDVAVSPGQPVGPGDTLVRLGPIG